MPVGDSKQLVQISLDKDVVALLDDIAEKMGIPRSRIIVSCIESGIDELTFLSYLGLNPRRMKKVASMLERLGVRSKGDVTIDFRKVRKVLKLPQEQSDD